MYEEPVKHYDVLKVSPVSRSDVKYRKITEQYIQLIEVEEYKPDETEVMALAQMAAGEYCLCETPWQKMQCAAVMFCCCWRSLKGTSAGFRDNVVDVVSQPYQFHGYSPTNNVTPELLAMAEDVLIRVHRVTEGETELEAGCVLPSDYLWFQGTGTVNIFRNAYIGGQTWDWSWPNPYE